MKLVVAIVQDQDVYNLNADLTEAGFRITKLASTGGFLKTGNSTLLIGTEDENVDKCLEIIENDCKSRETTTSMLSVSMPGTNYISYPVEVMVGGATSSKLSSTGGFLKKGNTTMLIGTDVEKEQSILDLIKKVCDENDIESDNESKANIFVMDLEDFKKF